MIPVEGVFSRFKRIIRDLSKELDKPVNFVIEGEDTELDKKIVDSLGDPLTHMVRNALDHGIEDADTRKKLGKNAEGQLLLKASHRGNHIWIEVADDGKGLSRDKIAATALKKALVTQDQLNKMSPKDVLNIIFLPGFSTAEKVTGVSGRGVGMDVVRAMINSVGGSIDIETEEGKGSTFVLKIPLTLAIIKALLVVTRAETFAFPIDSVSEIVKISTEEIYSVNGTDTIKLRDHALSLIPLEGVLKIKDSKPKDMPFKKVVVVTDGENKLGIEVEELIGEEEIVIKSLSDHFSKVRGITGASILGDGNIALILDSSALIDMSRN